MEHKVPNIPPQNFWYKCAYCRNEFPLQHELPESKEPFCSSVCMVAKAASDSDKARSKFAKEKGSDFNW